MHHIQDFVTQLDVLPQTESLINGQWTQPEVTARVLNKFTETIIAELGLATADQVSHAVDVARIVSHGEIPDPDVRSKSLRTAAKRLEFRRSGISALLTADASFATAGVKNEINRVIITLNPSTRAGIQLIGKTVPFSASPGVQRRVELTQRFPASAVCSTRPFNSPLNIVKHKTVPAYAASNVVTLKSSFLAPLVAAALSDILLAAGVSPEFLSILHGDGKTVGTALLVNQRINLYTPTRSKQVGIVIQGPAGLRRTPTELTSIANTIVCTNANINKAMPKTISAGSRNSGQVRTSEQRLYFAAAARDEVLKKLRNTGEKLFVDDPRHPTTETGLLMSRQAVRRGPNGLPKRSLKGRNWDVGGGRERTSLNPVTLPEVEVLSNFWCREVFAPIITFQAGDSLREAITSATRFGLSVLIKNIDATLKVAPRMRFGFLHINDASSADGGNVF